MVTSPFVSVIIPSYNSAKTIRQCLDSLLQQDIDHKRFEIIVIDSSDDSTKAIIKRDYPGVKLLELPQRAYAGTSRNIGIESAKGDIIAMIDADAEAGKDWVSRIIEEHRSAFLAIGGAVLNGHPESLVSWSEYFVTSSEYFEKSPRRFVRTQTTCNVSYKRETFEKYGSFSDSPRAQDVILNLKLGQHGEPILFEPSIKVYHLYRTRLKQLVKREILYGRARRQVCDLAPIRTPLITKNSATVCLYPILKFILITVRVLRWNRSSFFTFLRAIPIVWLVLLSSTYGMLTPGKSRDIDF
jgi:glycosyltransferase involved in cell wall biosynthesis